MSWLSSSKDAGAFAAASRRFAERFLPVVPPPGLESLLVLCAAIDRFAIEGEPSDEDAFLEGAGAFLASILIASHPGRARHVSAEQIHRLALGRHGSFDPFASVALALNGDRRARKVLAEELLRAEAELRGEGPLARMAKAFEEALTRTRPELAVVSRFESELTLSDETRVDLRKAIDATGDLPMQADVPAVHQAAQKLVDMLPGGTGSGVSLEDALPRLCPRLVGPGFASEAQLHCVPFRGELRIALVVRMGDRARFVLASDLPRWQAEPDALLLRALDNLALASREAKVHREGLLSFLRSGDGLDSARLLLPGLHETLAPVLGDSFVAAVPHRDVLWLGPEEHAELLRVRAHEDYARAPHRISAELFRVHAQGIQSVTHGA